MKKNAINKESNKSNSNHINKDRYPVGIKLHKSMGQNFLIDKNIPLKIVKLSGLDESSGVLEIGPGAGALTKELAKTAEHVTSVELDKRLIPSLNEMFSSHDNVSIIQGDILKLDINKIINETMPGLDYHVCANLPYNITSPVITAFIEANIFKSITVMVQKEVALRICAKPGTSQYGAFTVYTNYHSIPKILFDVSPESFSPKPKVTSSVIYMELRKTKLLCPEREKLFFRVVRAAFEQRRKTLVNALSASFTGMIEKKVISQSISDCGFDTRIRGEILSVEEFILLTEKLKTNCNYL